PIAVSAAGRQAPCAPHARAFAARPSRAGSGPPTLLNYSPFIGIYYNNSHPSISRAAIRHRGARAPARPPSVVCPPSSSRPAARTWFGDAARDRKLRVRGMMSLSPAGPGSAPPAAVVTTGWRPGPRGVGWSYGSPVGPGPALGGPAYGAGWAFGARARRR